MSVDAWSGKHVLISLSEQGGSDIELASSIGSVNVSGGSKNSESVPLINNGRIYKFSPQEDYEIEFEGYYIGAEITGSDVSPAYYFHGDTSSGYDSDPWVQQSSINRVAVRLAILHTEDSSATSGAGEVTAGQYGQRVVLADGYITDLNYEYDASEGLWKATYTVKFAPFDKAGNACYKNESTKSTGLSALSSYTSSTKW